MVNKQEKTEELKVEQTNQNKVEKIEYYHPAIQSVGQLSKECLNSLAIEYKRGLGEAIKNVRTKSSKIGDEFVDEVFNDYKDDTLLSWITGGECCYLHLSKCRDIESDMVQINFCYLLETRDKEDSLKDMESWDLGEENELITHLREKHNLR